jgi:Suppressor of fused protein (SUFU)
MTSPEHGSQTAGGSLVTHAKRRANPELDILDDSQRRALKTHLDQHLGKCLGTFAEITSEYVRLDLLIYPATEQRRFAVICTLGSSARAMAVTDNMRDYAHQEFFVCVPPEWPLPGSPQMDDDHWWPFRMLKDIARLAHAAQSFAAPATTIPNGDPAQPYVAGSLLTAAMVWTPIGMPEGLATCDAPGRRTRISQVIALTADECEMKLGIGVDEAMTILVQFAPDFPVMNPQRECAATKFLARVKGEDGLNDSFATRPGGITMSEQRLREWVPDLFRHEVLPPPFNQFYGKKACSELITDLTQHLSEGDAQPAVVVRLDPLLIAAHTDELDCVALLMVEPERAKVFVARHQLTPGSRLMAVNCYYQKGSRLDQQDVVQGPKARGIYGAFYPLIADFLTEDGDALARMKARISDDEWADVERKTKLLTERKGWIVRAAHPLLSLLSGTPLENRMKGGQTAPTAQPRRAPVTRHSTSTTKQEGSGLPGWVWVIIGLVILGIVRAVMRD